MTKRRTMTTLTTIPTTEMSTDDYHDYENNEDNKSTTNMITTRVLEPSVLRRGGGDIDSDNFRGSGSSGHELKLLVKLVIRSLELVRRPQQTVRHRNTGHDRYTIN